MNATANISIRTAEARDYPTIWQVAALDDSSVPSGRLLVAELEGEVIAAVSLDSGRAIADPFRRSADLVALLEVARRRHATRTTPARTRLTLRPA